VNLARGLAIGLVVVALVAAASLTQPRAARAGDGEPELSATLDGRAIPLEDVGKYDCDDFSYPEIRCSSSRVLVDARALAVTLLTGTDYVTIYDGTGFGGAFMNVSEDYSALSLIGWNDRISSFKGRNGQSGAFYVDWFYSGAWWTFCCNQQSSNLGTFSNTFSSIRRT
jgi:hypothetical protein